MGSFTSDGSAPRDQIIKKDYYGDDQEEMNQASCHLENHPPEEPGNDENDGEPYHGMPSRGS